MKKNTICFIQSTLNWFWLYILMCTCVYVNCRISYWNPIPNLYWIISHKIPQNNNCLKTCAYFLSGRLLHQKVDTQSCCISITFALETVQSHTKPWIHWCFHAKEVQLCWNYQHQAIHICSSYCLPSQTIGCLPVAPAVVGMYIAGTNGHRIYLTLQCHGWQPYANDNFKSIFSNGNIIFRGFLLYMGLTIDGSVLVTQKGW